MASNPAELGAANAAAQTQFERFSGGWVSTYLTVRHLDSAVSTWGLGFADAGWNTLRGQLRKQFADAVLLDAGLCTPTRDGRLIDTFRDRLTFPIRDTSGTVIGFTGRAKPGADSRTPKYLNTKSTPLFDKSVALFGIERLHASSVAVLVEGPADAISVSLSGGGQFVGVAACGSAWTSCHIDAVVAAIGPSGRLIIATDADHSGRKSLVALHRQLSAFPHLRVEALAMPAGTDPAQLHHRGTLPIALRGAKPATLSVAAVIIDGYRDSLQWAEGRIAAVRAVAPLVLACPSDLRDTLIEQIAVSTTMSPASIQQTIAVDLPVDQGAIA